MLYLQSTRALGWGRDADSGDTVAFAIRPQRGAWLRRLLEAGQRPVVHVDATDVLFVHPPSAGS